MAKMQENKPEPIIKIPQKAPIRRFVPKEVTKFENLVVDFLT